MERPSWGRKLAAVAIDALVLLIVAPLLALLLTFGLWFLVSRGQASDCAAPCDGAPMLAFGLGFTVLWMVWVLYWPLLIFWRRRTIGTRVLGMKFDGQGLRRHLVRTR